jgi:hypothetical protein
MRQERFSKTAIRYLSAALVLALLLVPVSISPAAAQDISEYFDFSYEPVQFVDEYGAPKTDIDGYETFYAELRGNATCKQDLQDPLDKVEELRLTFEVVAEHESDGERTLNSGYAITISPFPKTQGAYTEIHELVPLKFAGGSQSGTYNVSGRLIKAEVKVPIFGWMDITDQIPPDYRTLPMDGPVTYTAPPNSAPDMPQNPSPANGATGVSVPVTLSVAVSDIDNDIMTVTFFDGSDNTIGTDAGVPSGSRAEVNWSGLAADTTYDWYAKANDGELDSPVSDTWSFTTAPPNSAPNQPSNPSPVNHATGISIDVDMRWMGGDPDAGDTVTYDVYFGNSATPPFKETIGPYPATQSSITYDPWTLNPDTKYYWKIVAEDNHGVQTVGPVWDFTTGLPGEADYWTKSQITQILTEGTATFEDDEAGELVHAVQWDKTPWLDEATWLNEADGILDGANGTVEVAEAFEWVKENINYVEDEDNYGISEAWTSPEQTLNRGSGDDEDLALLLASLLKFHTDEVDTPGGDLVYVECGFLVPPDQDLRFWVFWWDASSELGWYQLDPISGEMGLVLSLGLSTLWLNDDHVFGYLSGYYPQPAAPVGGFDKEDFAKISGPLGGGFGDDRNNYAWSMTESNGDLYAGTGRNCGYIMLSRFWPGVIPEGIVTPIADPTAGTQEYLQFLEDMQAEIWRYRDGDWELVHQAETVTVPNPQPPPESIPFPEGVGYRVMTTLNGAIYAGVAGFGDVLDIEVPSPLILTSPSGDLGTWEPVNHTGLEGTNTRSMTVHNGKIYVGTSIGDPARAAIFASADPANEGWTKVADFVGTTNTEVIGLKSFNDCLYVTTQGTLDLDTGTVHGFEVWRSTVEDPVNPDLLDGGDWKQIVTEGAGDSRNYWGASIEVLGDHIYVGSISLPLFDGVLVQTFKGFDLIRIDKDDDWELVIGSYPEFVGIPNPTTGERGIPISGLPAGFGAPLNFYCWSLEEYDGVLYLGTLDLSSLLSCLPVELLAETFDLPQEQMAQMQEKIAPFAGADLWKTSDGITWEPVSLDGFGNPHNYGFRTMVSGSLYVGTANPYVGQGCEVWAALPGPAGPTETWDLPWGLDADPASVNIWTYSRDAVAVTLADVEWSMPPGLLIWHYGGPTEGWRFYKKGWGAVNTLETLTPGKGYIGIVPTAGNWEIPQE